MNFINEEDITLFEVGQHGGQITGFFQHRAGCGLNGHTHFIGNDVGERGLAQPRRTKDQHMIQCLLATSRGGNEDFHLLPHSRLTNIVRKHTGTDRSILHFLILSGLGCNQAIRFNH